MFDREIPGRLRRGVGLSLMLVLLVGLLTGCSRQRFTASMTAPLIEAAIEDAYASGDPQTVREGMAGQLLLLRGLCRSHPGHLKISTTTVQFYASFAMLFIQAEDPAWSEQLYAEGKDLGLRFLMRESWFAKAWGEGPDRLRQELTERQPERLAPILMWTAACLGQHILLHQDRPREMLALPYVDVLLDASIDMQPDYFYGMPLTIKGIMLATMPQGYGGNLEEANRYFERAVAVEDGFLMHRVFQARCYSVAALDRGSFLALLQSVEAAPADILPEIRLINILARRSAADLLGRQDELF
ncbi:MAG: TRAP transporter TatT component family protein [Candidatus Eisenbacteria bacterium]